MYQKWRIPLTFIIGIIIVLFLFPKQGLAVEYSITNVEIDAYLQENGNIKVKETHTYSFDGEFNGITREIIPKEGSWITEFKAIENGKPLRTEKEDDLNRIYRKGADETITIDLMYSIQNGLDVYSDVADFYWPFFDERNESTYENLIVTVHPPKTTDQVIAFGYDEAFKSEQITSDGSVLFTFGEVPYGENGDIRVAYDAALFPTTPLTANKPMREEILKEEQGLLDEAASHAQTQEQLSTIAKIGIPIFTILLLLLMFSTFMKARLKKKAIERETSETLFIPKQTISLPATLTYTNSYHHPAEAMAAALMDLVRKGYVIKEENDHFKVGSLPQEILNHEKQFIHFLFNETGSNNEFSFEDLASYTKRTTNHQNYHSSQLKWSQSIHEEIKEANLYEKSGKFRWLVGISSVLLLPLLVLFPFYDLFAWFAVTLGLFFTVIFYAMFYRPKTWKGLKITHEWTLVKQHLKELNVAEWKTLTDDEKMRAYIYGIGIKDKNIIQESEKLVKPFKQPVQNPPYQHGIYAPVDIATIAYLGPMASSSFYSANQRTESTVSSSSSSSSSSGGTGGGGGGSGAF
jgi:uncharacterized membrane protein